MSWSPLVHLQLVNLIKLLLHLSQAIKLLEEPQVQALSLWFQLLLRELLFKRQC